MIPSAVEVLLSNIGLISLDAITLNTLLLGDARLDNPVPPTAGCRLRSKAEINTELHHHQHCIHSSVAVGLGAAMYVHLCNFVLLQTV